MRSWTLSGKDIKMYYDVLDNRRNTTVEHLSKNGMISANSWFNKKETQQV